MSLNVPSRASAWRPAPKAGAQRAATIAFAAQGVSVAAVYTTVPAVTEHLKLAPLLTTTVMVAVALMAGGGSFLGLAVIRRAGPVATIRGAVLTAVAALVLIGRAADEATVICAYILFGLAVGALDVGVNTRAAAVERAYSRSVFGSFYTAWSVGGVVAALLTAGAARLEWSVADGLNVQAGIVLLLALCIRSHALPSSDGPSDTLAQPPLGRRLWIRLVPFGLVLLVVYVVESTVSAWSAVYLRQTLAASLTVAPLAYAAYQAGTVVGRAATDQLVQKFGAAAVVRTAILMLTCALAGMAAAPSWPFAVLAAGAVGLGASVLAPLCLASAARLRPAASEVVLARLNLFNYVGVVTGGAVSGLLGSTGQFRLAYAAPAALAVLLLAAARHFTQPPSSARMESVPPVDRADPRPFG
ncbi:MFS transporter [Streptomyces lunaelactis]|uniref:MFS transporter n=1 Tax=Streptomyces lunaelactis TaxID=1535768 RepID=UPI0015850AEA|nr:MFS transporter [Streptomyces lunaelactis]NUK43144.1 MFS transporter [Streptomyces lunaelactis]NUK70856.1 MFS transporter [Streptomyces lunaelactis]NUK79420.1 MFS transporter [Streptomyces lunaelactis]NUK90984.1 MFS transporter [Streptomyces lunaelactis]NUL29096.1 MFS transporter [Streptomyces lunaelactis]